MPHLERSTPSEWKGGPPDLAFRGDLVAAGDRFASQAANVPMAGLQLGLAWVGDLAALAFRALLKGRGILPSPLTTAGMVIADETATSLVTQNFRQEDGGFANRFCYELLEGMVARGLVIGLVHLTRVQGFLAQGFLLLFGALLAEGISTNGFGSRIRSTPWTLEGLALRMLDTSAVMMRGRMLRPLGLDRILKGRGLVRLGGGSGPTPGEIIARHLKASDRLWNDVVPLALPVEKVSRDELVEGLTNALPRVRTRLETQDPHSFGEAQQLHNLTLDAAKGGIFDIEADLLTTPEMREAYRLTALAADVHRLAQMASERKPYLLVRTPAGGTQIVEAGRLRKQTAALWQRARRQVTRRVWLDAGQLQLAGSRAPVKPGEPLTPAQIAVILGERLNNAVISLQLDGAERDPAAPYRPGMTFHPESAVYDDLCVLRDTIEAAHRLGIQVIERQVDYGRQVGIPYGIEIEEGTRRGWALLNRVLAAKPDDFPATGGRRRKSTRLR